MSVQSRSSLSAARSSPRESVWGWGPKRIDKCRQRRNRTSQVGRGSRHPRQPKKMTQRDRDKSVEQWLRQTPVPGAQADDCLDAETLAAWAEGVLDGPQRATAEAHASNCARCQAMLAVMVRTTPAAAASTGSPIRKWLMMLGPPMAAAAAVALWFAVGQDPRTPVLDSLSKQQAKAEVESAPSLALPSSARSVPDEVDRKVAPPSSDAAVESRERAAPQTLADARKEREAPPDSAATTRGCRPSDRRQREEGSRRSQACGCRHRGGSDRCGSSSSSGEPRAATAASRRATSRPRACRPQRETGRRRRPAQPRRLQHAAGRTRRRTRPRIRRRIRIRFRRRRRVRAVPAAAAGARRARVVADKPAASTADDSAAASRAGGRGGVAGGVADDAALSFRAKAGDFELAAAASTDSLARRRRANRAAFADAGATWSNQYTAPQRRVL